MKHMTYQMVDLSSLDYHHTCYSPDQRIHDQSCYTVRYQRTLKKNQAPFKITYSEKGLPGNPFPYDVASVYLPNDEHKQVHLRADTLTAEQISQSLAKLGLTYPIRKLRRQRIKSVLA